MKMWDESTRILEELQHLRSAGERAALAILVRIEGSSYRRPGAKMLVSGTGSRWGSLSGGCLEEDVRQVALEVLQGVVPRQLQYKTGSDEDTVWGLGLGCDGIVDIFVQPAMTPQFDSTVAAQMRLLEGEERFSVTTLIESPEETGQPGSRIVVAAGEILAGSTGESALDARILDMLSTSSDGPGGAVHRCGAATLFVEVFEPPPNLLVIGGGDDAIPLVQLAAEVGFRVIVVDHRTAYLTPERFPAAWRIVEAGDGDATEGVPMGNRTYAITKTHHLKRDRAWVRRLLSEQVPYVGLLGPRDRREEILSDLAVEDRSRVFGPVGLDLGAEGPEQVALSVVAELLAVASGRRGGHLRDAAGPIHAGLDRSR